MVTLTTGYVLNKKENKGRALVEALFNVIPTMDNENPRYFTLFLGMRKKARVEYYLKRIYSLTETAELPHDNSFRSTINEKENN